MHIVHADIDVDMHQMIAQSATFHIWVSTTAPAIASWAMTTTAVQVDGCFNSLH